MKIYGNCETKSYSFIVITTIKMYHYLKEFQVKICMVVVEKVQKSLHYLVVILINTNILQQSRIKT